MKVSKQQTAQNRARILDSAARLFRERGLGGVGVDALADAAGLSYGSLYSRFGSKDALMAQAVEHAFAGFAERMGVHQSVAAYLDYYLSAAHRDAPGGGCTVAALGGDMSRQSDAVRGAFTDGLKGAMARIAARLPRRTAAPAEEGKRKHQSKRNAACSDGGTDVDIDAGTGVDTDPGTDVMREDDALAIIATLAGAVMMARAVDDPALSERILSAARTHLDHAL